jgi:hypothetical protein
MNNGTATKSINDVDVQSVIDSNKKKLKLVICSPFYEVKAWSPYVVSLVDSIRALNEMGITWDYYEVSGDSYVDRAKNGLVHRFMEQSDYTHLMMIDSDMSWELKGFLKMIKAILVGFPMVGAAYPCKNVWKFFGCIPNVEGEEKLIRVGEVGDVKLMDMWCLPGGFLIYSRKAFEMTKPFVNKYVEKVVDEKCQAIEQTPTFIHEYFKCNVENSTDRVGEDVYFQLRYKEAGGKIWCEPDVSIIHWGVKGWLGNYQQFMEGKDSSEVAGCTSNYVPIEKEPNEAKTSECGAA